MASLEKHDVFDIVTEVPPGTAVVDSKWVLTINRNLTGRSKNTKPIWWREVFPKTQKITVKSHPQ